MYCVLLAAVSAQAFTGTYGINYGRIANNILSPNEVVTLLRDNVQEYLPYTQIRGIAIGNEVLGGSDEFSGFLLGAVKNVYNALDKLKLSHVVQVTTAHSQAVFGETFPPSGAFKDNVVQYMKPLLEFFSQIGSPFCLNAYPFLAYMYNKDQIDINYALFLPTEGADDPKTKLHYDNLLDAQIDAAYAALENAGFGKMEVIITETGWASHGDENEAAATASNARTYNYNLRKRLAKMKGTPLRPKNVVKAYVFAIFNENMKPGPTSERNFGLFKPDGSISYDIGFKGLKSSSADSSLPPLKVRCFLPTLKFMLLDCSYDAGKMPNSHRKFEFSVGLAPAP
ncbi:glucan endo-1,3-beta-glucosidase 14-like isoform X4 [Hibiscus syriacus]|uniref:glucan endo-1,3-beta-D-glucosidase n=1 Tax=Hibiscus syriacus TaxID=106335 RepID=A0A6A2WEK2_HIBSY|nr:glucan endo-1,3-beta-glucosidase 14-like isoform X4 [Hibiscus syriacus]